MSDVFEEISIGVYRHYGVCSYRYGFWIGDDRRICAYQPIWIDLETCRDG
jgi:hypothetical protein